MESSLWSKGLVGDPKQYFRTHLLKDCCPDGIVEVLYPTAEWNQVEREEQLCKRFIEMHAVVFESKMEGQSLPRSFKGGIPVVLGRSAQHDKTGRNAVREAVAKFRDTIRSRYESLKGNVDFLSATDLKCANREGQEKAVLLVLKEVGEDELMKNKALERVAASCTLELGWILKVNEQRRVWRTKLIVNSVGGRVQKQMEVLFTPDHGSSQKLKIYEKEEMNGILEDMMINWRKELEGEFAAAQEWLGKGVKDKLEMSFFQRVNVLREQAISRNKKNLEKARALMEAITDDLHVKYQMEVEAMMVRKVGMTRQEQEEKMKQFFIQSTYELGQVGCKELERKYADVLKKRMEETLEEIGRRAKEKTEKRFEVYSKELQKYSRHLMKKLTNRCGIEEEAATRLELVLTELFQLETLKQIAADRTLEIERSSSRKRPLGIESAHLSPVLEGSDLVPEPQSKRNKSGSSLIKKER